MKSTGKARGPYKRSEVVRFGILDAAVEQLIDEGYRNFSLRKVAGRAGVSIGSLQHHFVSRENLISVMLDEVISAYLRDFERALNDSGSPEEQLRSIVTRVVEDLTTRKTTGFFPELWSLANHDPAVNRLMQKMYGRYQDIYHRIIPAINPRLSEAQVRSLGLFMVASLEGHTMFVGHGKPYEALSGALARLACDSFLQIIRSGAIPDLPASFRGAAAANIVADSSGREREKMSDFDSQLERMKLGRGFVAALDQSGGSTPKALALYGVRKDAWLDEAGMFALVHKMRSRIMTSRAFDARLLAAILFEDTLDREVAGLPTADYLWQKKRIVPILKIDKGLADAAGGVQLMKPAPALDELLAKAKAGGVFGTKMRSVIQRAEKKGIREVVAQQFDWARRVAAAGLVPIIEPEVDIHAPDKADAEALLKEALLAGLNSLQDELVMFKLSLPTRENFYRDFMAHDRVLRVLALSGGYARDEANALLARNQGMIASFSRALTEGLTAQLPDDDFDKALDASIESIYQASGT